MNPFVIGGFLIFTVLFILVFYYFFKKAHAKQLVLKELEINLLRKTALESEKERALLGNEKRKAEEKNRKLWTMSETVHKERRLVDEANEKLSEEKEKLAADKRKLDEKIKKLWSQSTAIHREKERINELKLEIEQKHQEILDSVNYAKRIQEAILPDLNDIATNLPESFILFKPRDIVSGDFYWFSVKNGKSIIAAVDCTGHGVPGAFMSMIGNTLLNEIVNEKGIVEPGQILHYLNDEVNRSLKQTRQDSDSRDGMDVGICTFDFITAEMQYAGANRPLYYVKDILLNSNGDSSAGTTRQLIEVKADKFAIGGLDYDTPKKFNTQSFQFQRGETIYISTDGFADQFSPHDKKLMTRKFKEILLEIHLKSMAEQRDFLDEFIENWKGTMEQTDDILVIGVRV